jgi:hypothetical protein
LYLTFYLSNELNVTLYGYGRNDWRRLANRTERFESHFRATMTQKEKRPITSVCRKWR